MSMLDGKVAGPLVRGPNTNLVAAGVGNAVAIFQISAGAQLVGTKSARIKKLTIRNIAAGNTYLHVGTGVGAAFVDLITPKLSLNGLDDAWEGDELAEAEAFANITAYPEALVAAGSIDAQVECEEIG